MPYKSLKQERYFHANKTHLEKQGVNVAEWDKASKGKKLPQYAPSQGLKEVHKRISKMSKRVQSGIKKMLHK